MGRRALLTQNASCGPDVEEWHHWPHWPHWSHHDEGTSTSYVDLQTAAEQQQHNEDKDYVSNYYHKQAARRKRHKENKKEHVRQAQERLAMSLNDYPATRLYDQIMQGVDMPAETKIDKSSMPPLDDSTKSSQVAPAQTTGGRQPLASAIMAVAANLDLVAVAKRENFNNGCPTKLGSWINHIGKQLNFTLQKICSHINL